MTIGNYHGDVATIQKNLIQFCNSASFGSSFTLRHVLQQHVYKIIETLQSTHNLLVIFHNNVYPRTNALVDQFYKRLI